MGKVVVLFDNVTMTSAQSLETETTGHATVMRGLVVKTCFNRDEGAYVAPGMRERSSACPTSWVEVPPCDEQVESDEDGNSEEFELSSY